MDYKFTSHKSKAVTFLVLHHVSNKVVSTMHIWITMSFTYTLR